MGMWIFCTNALYASSQMFFLSAGLSLTSIAAGYIHACAVASGGGLWCWGDNSYGQLGINSTVQQNSPVPVSLGTGGAGELNCVSGGPFEAIPEGNSSDPGGLCRRQ